ncbi:MAG: hypothetical protein JSU04_18655 [Bdellovibrionales bacterium]|nr:hypothetical protein [Bdellovibrionales bacterium]
MKSAKTSLFIFLSVLNASVAFAGSYSLDPLPISQSLTDDANHIPQAERDRRVGFIIESAQNFIAQNAKDSATLGEQLKHPSDTRMQYAARLNAIADQYGQPNGAFKTFYKKAAYFVLNSNVYTASAVPSNGFTVDSRQKALDLISENGSYATYVKQFLAKILKLKAAMDAAKDEDIAAAMYGEIRGIAAAFDPFHDYTVYVEPIRSGFIDSEILVKQMKIPLANILKTTGQCPFALTQVSIDEGASTPGEEQYLLLTDLNTFSLVNDYKVMLALLEGPRGHGPVVASCPEASFLSSSFSFDEDKGVIVDTFKRGSTKIWSETIVPKVDSTELIQKLRALYH